MKKLNFIILASFFILVFNSCNDEVDEALNKELFNKIVGRWELVSEACEHYRDGVFTASHVNYDFPFMPGIPGEEDTVYFVYLNFKDNGFVVKETDNNYEVDFGYRWEVENNRFNMWMYDIGENYCEIFQLTDTKFHFSQTYKGRTAYGSIQTKDITTFELKR